MLQVESWKDKRGTFRDTSSDVSILKMEDKANIKREDASPGGMLVGLYNFLVLPIGTITGKQ